MEKGYETSDNAAVVRRWFEEVWNKGRADAIDEMFHEEGVPCVYIHSGYYE